MTGENGQRGARTVLEEQIRARRMTFEEFIEYAENYARQNNQTGTLSLRHLHRLASGEPTGPPRPATRRLLEAIFGMPWDQLLASPYSGVLQSSEEAQELSRQIQNARRVDSEVVRLLAAQTDAIRRLDRRFGAAELLDQLRRHAAHIDQLLGYAVNLGVRRDLAAALTDAHTLAGWQSLDLGKANAAWNHYRQACEAAREAESPTLLAHAQAEQAVVLTDAGQTSVAIELTGHAHLAARRSAPALLRAWLAAAHGEALAAHGNQFASMQAFDEAAAMLPQAPDAERDPGTPYVALNSAHLARWRGHALARFGHPEAAAVLLDALTHHDPTFVRAETSLRADLTLTYRALGERAEASRHHARAVALAEEIGSVRQRRRLD